MDKVLISGEGRLYDLEYRVYLMDFIALDMDDMIDTDLLEYDKFVKERVETEEDWHKQQEEDMQDTYKWLIRQTH